MNLDKYGNKRLSIENIDDCLGNNSKLKKECSTPLQKKFAGHMEKANLGEFMEIPRKRSEKYKEEYDTITAFGNKPYPSFDHNL